MDILQNIILGRAGQRQQPPEIEAIKNYALDNFKESVQVMVRDKDIVITCPSPALASSLRMHGPKIKAACGISKRLVFKIG